MYIAVKKASHNRPLKSHQWKNSVAARIWSHNFQP